MFDQHQLPSGLRIIGEKLTHVRSCTIGVWVKVGSMNETPQENGLSHFIEHMVFKGTQNRNARQIAEEMDAIGGQLNAFTAKECTCFYAKVTDDQVAPAVDILADLTLRPLFDETELNKERGVVLEEIAMVEDTPDDLVHDLLSDAQFNGSLRYPILGTGALIRAYSREDLVHYWQRHYTPSNMVIAIAGNYDWNSFLQLVEAHFASIPNADLPAVPFEPQHFVSGRKTRVKDTEQLQLCIGYKGVENGCEEMYPLAVLSNALGGGMSSRLFQRIREELGMAYSVYTYPSSYKGVGSFNLYAGTSPENGEVVLHELQEQVALLLQNGLTQKEFNSAKMQLRSGYLMGLESSSRRMQSLGRGILLLDYARTPDEIIASIDSVTMEDVDRLAKELLTVSPSVAIVGKNADDYLRYIGG